MTIANAQTQGKHPRGFWPSTSGLALGGKNSFVKAVQVAVVNFDRPSVATIAVEEDNVTVTGARIGDLVSVCPQTFTANLLEHTNARVSAADTVPTASCNPTAGAIDAAAKDLFFTLFQVR